MPVLYKKRKDLQHDRLLVDIGIERGLINAKALNTGRWTQGGGKLQNLIPKPCFNIQPKTESHSNVARTFYSVKLEDVYSNLFKKPSPRMVKIVNKLVIKMLTLMIPFPFKKSHAINCLSKQIYT